MTTRRITTLVLLLVGVLLITGMLIFFTLNEPFIHNELIALDLIPKPETLTELYFKENADLPRSTTSNQIVRFAFVIHNLETTDYQYTYNVSVHTNGAKRIIESRNIVVKNNEYYVKNEEFKLTPSSGRTEIVVELVNKQQSIHFWIGA